MLSLLARAAAAGPLGPLGRSPFSSLVPPPGPPAFVAGLKTKTVLKRRCKDCYIVRRRGRLYIYCKTNPRHKQRKL